MRIYISNICIPYRSRQFVHTDIVVCFPYSVDRIFASIKLARRCWKTLQCCIQACFPKSLNHICSLVYVRMPNMSQLCQSKLHFSWKYLLVVVEMISSCHKNLANPKDKCAKENLYCIRIISLLMPFLFQDRKIFSFL